VCVHEAAPKFVFWSATAVLRPITKVRLASMIQCNIMGIACSTSSHLHPRLSLARLEHPQDHQVHPNLHVHIINEISNRVDLAQHFD
jgi:hypothetical protein